ncbi:MAG: hypothetical protein K0S96_1750, partial [Geminicoccaceae bacterium]|nr:hypothetical protein [Geminicoccaceae bacterium]
MPQAPAWQERRVQLLADIGAAQPDVAQQAVVEVLKGASVAGEPAPLPRGLERR